MGNLLQGETWRIYRKYIPFNSGMDSFGPELLERGFRVGEWQVEPMANRVVRGEEVVQVEPKVMRVLCCLAERPGRTVTKERFMERVWEDTIVTNDVLARCISELRKVLGDDWRRPEYVETIRKTGYRLIAPVSHAGEAPPSGRPSNLRPGKRLRRIVGDTRVRVAAVVFVVLLALGGGLLWGLGSAQPDPAAPPSTTPFTSFRGREIDPAISPEGTRIAFAWDGGAGDHQNLYIKQIGAETPLRITDVSADEWSPTWSPDGRFLAFARKTGERYDIYVAPAIGGTVRKVATTGYREIHSVHWSPDTSRQSLVLSMREAPYSAFGLHLLPLDRDTLLQLTSPPPHTLGDTHPVFSRDGSQVAFARGPTEEVQDVYVLQIENGVPRSIGFDDSGIRGITWSSDGRELIVAANSTGGSGLWRVPVSRARRAEWILTASEGSILEDPTLSANAPRLAYVQRTSTANVWELARATGYQAFSARAILASTRWDGYADIAPSDTALIAFSSGRSGYMEIWKAEPDGSQPLQLTSFESQSYSPRWSPDASRLAFVSREQGNANIYLMDADGRSVKQVTRSRAEDILPNWSADGSALYFSSDRSGSWEVWRLDISGGPPEQITKRGGLEAQEAPDGTALYVLRPNTAGVWRRPIIKPAIASMVPTVQAVSLNQGRRVGPRQQSAPGDSILANAFELVVPDVDPDDAGNWRVTMRGIYYVRRGAKLPDLIRFDPATGRTIRLSTLDQVPLQPGLAVSASGDRFLYTQVDRDESDIVLVEPVY